MLKKKYLNPHTSFTRKPSAFLAALLFTYLLFSASGAEIELSEREAAWLREHPSVTIALDENNAPLNFKGTGGTYAGISVDFMELIGQKAGLDILYWGGTWDEALQRAFDHEVDGIMSASYKEERLQYLNFTDPYCEMPMAVATRKGHQGGEYLSSFNGERFAVVRASVRVPIIQQHCPDSEILLVETSLEGMRALAEGRTDVYFDDLPVVQHLIEQQLMSNLKVALLYYYPRAGAQRVGLRNDQPELLSVFDKAIDAITVEERREIISKWLGLGRDAPEHRDIPLTGEEMEWLREHRTVRVAIDPSWPPIEWKDASGNYQGITMDYLAALEKILNVQFEIINGDSWEAMLLAPEKLNVDLFPSLSPTPPRREYMGFT
ncbi:MAG: transporter substrate-binding domain-containing protein, partial [Candidatus Sumerlaeota bacterium]